MTDQDIADDPSLCRFCRGESTTRVFVGGGMMTIPCIECKQTGRVTPEVRAKQDAGEQLRHWRLAIRELSLRRAAWYLGISATRLSQLEQGHGLLAEIRRCSKSLENFWVTIYLAHH